MTEKPKGHSAVMADRQDKAREANDDFPTPPWATRALTSFVLPALVTKCTELPRDWRILEPACGRGIMSSVLEESFDHVEAFDRFDYGGNAVGSFLPGDLDYRAAAGRPDWIVTNPPFKVAEAFAREALAIARVGVAFLVRLAFLEGKDRYRLYREHPYTFCCPFADRVPMVEGRWDPEASTATAYAWFVWVKDAPDAPAQLHPIPPGQRKALTKPDDIERFASTLYKLGCPGKAEGIARKVFGNEADALQWWQTDPVITEAAPKDRKRIAVERIKDIGKQMGVAL